jgi:hypothetical protein
MTILLESVPGSWYVVWRAKRWYAVTSMACATATTALLWPHGA